MRVAVRGRYQCVPAQGSSLPLCVPDTLCSHELLPGGITGTEPLLDVRTLVDLHPSPQGELAIVGLH